MRTKEKTESKETNCLLAEDINTCACFDRESGMCIENDGNCGMFNKYYRNPHSTYVRKPRWYEKYYRKDSFVS